MFGLTIISKKKYNEDFASAGVDCYDQGYKHGYKAGQQDALFETCTPNMIRAALGYELIESEKIRELYNEACNRVKRQ